MNTETATRGQKVRRTAKSGAVVDHLREQIISGLRPAERLATFNVMAERYGVSRAVLREAVEELKRDGFIFSVDRQGLFVADRPPHLSRFGLVFATHPTHAEWPRFFTALQQQSVALQQSRGDITFESYFDIGRGPGNESFERLVEDVRAQRVAGLLLMPGLHEMAQEGPLASLAVPHVYVCGDRNVGRVPSVATDGFALCDRMVQSLRDLGRVRLAVVAMGGNSADHRAYLIGNNVSHRPHWVQTVGRENVADVRGLVTLLMDYPAAERPDGLIILDDNLTEHAVGGLIEAGVTVGRDIDVAAHCNWPWPVASAVPIQRVGFHTGHILTASLNAIELLRNHRALATDQVAVPALFESELDQPWQAAEFGAL